MGRSLSSVAAFGGFHAQAGTPETMTAPFKNDVDVLNYALTLEHLEATFYREGLAKFANQDYLNANLQTSVRDYIGRIGQDEAEHVQTLTQVITQLGGAPVQAASYDFGYADLAGFLKVAMALENTGVAAYTGAAQYLIDSAQLLTAALTIHGVEARHAAYLNILNGASPFPDAVDQPKTPSEVLAIAGPFIRK
jgi:bacterioferritin (cytochrome b1)